MKITIEVKPREWARMAILAALVYLMIEGKASAVVVLLYRFLAK